jgi:O-antigen/teichoic acid export membrane protein
LTDQKIINAIYNRVIKNTGILYAKMGITMFISLYTTRLILNSLGANDFGVFNIVGGSIAMLGFLNVSMASATQRFMSYAEGEGNINKLISIFNVSIVLHFLIAIAMGLVLFVMGYILFNGVLNIPSDRISAAKLVYYFMIASTMVTVMTVPYDAVLNAHENMLYYALIGIVESLLKLGVAIVVVYTSTDKLIIYGFLMTCISLIIMVLMRIYCHQKYTECHIDPKKYFQKDLMKEMTGFAGWSLMKTSTSMFGNYGFSIVLNHFFGTLLNAADGVAGQLNGQLLAFSNTMMRALNPAIVKAEGGGGRENMLKLSLAGSKFSFFLFAFFAIPVLIESPYILHAWLKNVPDYAIIFCRLMFIWTLIEQLTLPLNTAIGAQGDIKRLSIIKSILNVLPIPIVYALFSFGFPPYSMYIVGIFIWGIIEGNITVYFAIKNCNLILNDFLKYVLYKCLIILLIPLAFGIIPTFIMPDTLLRLIMVISFSSLSFISVLFFVGLTSDEKLYLKVAANKITNKYFNPK